MMRPARLIPLGALAVLGLWIAGSIALRPPAPPTLRIAAPALASLAPHEIRFGSAELPLAGLLFHPEGPPRSVAVVIHGSGASHRESPWYLALTALLLEAGHAVLLPDKRGSERSGGDWRSASFEDLAQDSLAAVAAARSAFPGLPVGLIGMSQGGWIAPLAARRDPELAYVVNLSGAAVTPAEQLAFEEANTLAGLGVPRPLAKALAPLTAWRIRTFVQPDLWSRIADFDPGPHWADVQIPALIVWGAEDEDDNLPVAGSLRRLHAVGNPMIQIEIVPGVGHALADREEGRLSPALHRILGGFLSRAIAAE